jgi:hypothetical protein
MHHNYNFEDNCKGEHEKDQTMNKTITSVFAALLSLLFFTGCFFLFACSSEAVKNSLTEQNLNGRVKSLTETTYPVDSTGKITDSIFLEQIMYRYNSKGNKIAEIHYYPDSLNELATFKYNLSGKKVEKRWRDTNNEIDHLATFRYDKKGNNIEKRWSETDGSLMKKEIYLYDENGNKTAEEIISIEDTTSERRTFSFDNRHNLIEEIRYSSDDSIPRRYSYKYLEFDKEGNWLKRMQYQKSIPLTITLRKIEY